MNRERFVELEGGITAVRGVRAAGVHCGIKKAKPDLALIRTAEPSPVAGVFTTNRVKAAPVLWCQKRLQGGRRLAAARLRGDGGPEAARAIMTTDTVPKEAAVAVDVEGRRVHVGGMTKGAGRIAPRLATMLGFLATDAVLQAPELQALLVEAVDRSFHCITVDGDTSTNDTVLCFATGKAGGPPLPPGAPGWTAFREALVAGARPPAQN